MNNKILEYKGLITFDKIEELLTQFNHNILSKTSALCKIRLFSILVECLENSYRHNYKLPDQHPEVELLLTECDNTYRLEISNLMDIQKLPALTERIEKLNNLDTATIKKAYNETIQQAHISEKGGAGLGLLKILRCTRQNFEYKVQKTDEYSALFTLTINISDNQNNQ